MLGSILQIQHQCIYVAAFVNVTDALSEAPGFLSNRIGALM